MSVPSMTGALRAFVLASALVSVPAAACPAFAAEIAGLWRTNYGPISFVAGADGSVTGSYRYKNLPANFFGRLQNTDLWGGVWVQQTSEVTCAKIVRGSRFWGRVVFYIQGDDMIGAWNYCGRRIIKREDRLWRGVRVEPTTGEPPAPFIAPKNENLDKALQRQLR